MKYIINNTKIQIYQLKYSNNYNKIMMNKINIIKNIQNN